MCRQMVAMFRKGDNTEFLTSDKKIGMVQTEHYFIWPTARQPHVLSSCHLTEGLHAQHDSDSFSQENTQTLRMKKKEKKSERE